MKKIPKAVLFFIDSRNWSHVAYSITLLIQQYWRKQAACCASTSSAAHCHVDLSWYKCHGGPQEGLAVLSVFVVRPWRSERVEAVGFQSFLYEQRVRICFQSHQNTRAAQKIKLNGKCIRHSGVFVWNGDWFFARFCPTCARRCHFCMGIITNHVIWIVYLIKIKLCYHIYDN